MDDEKLRTLLDSAAQETIDPQVYAHFRQDVTTGRRLVYLTDNCGEIVLDKLLMQVLRERYPQLDITVLVRGQSVLNDATLEDAKMVGLTELANVIPNGTAVAGTDLESISSTARKRLMAADVILSKGQGNFETLHGCGLNVYYLFLCKCDWFVKRFRMQRYQGQFINERNLCIPS